MIANGDTNHMQPFFLEILNGQLQFSGYIATTSSTNYRLSRSMDLWTYWTHVAVTYNTTGTSSTSILYINGTMRETLETSGKILRWHDSSMLILGGYALGPTSTIMKDRFIGWIDDWAFYNRVLSPDEISSNWYKVPNVSDSSLFIYYNFDEGPGASTIKNLGTVGDQADLENGKLAGSEIYYDAVGRSIRNVAEAKWVSTVEKSRGSQGGSYFVLFL